MRAFDVMKGAFGGPEVLGSFDIPEIEALGPIEGVAPVGPVTEEELIAPLGEFAPPPPRPALLEFIKEPYYWMKELAAGVGSGVEAIGKLGAVFEIPEAGELIEAGRGIEEYWAPELPAPIPELDIPRQAFRATGQSATIGLAGALLSRRFGPKAISAGWRLLMGWLASRGGVFAGAQYYDVMQEAVKTARAQGIPEDQIEAYLEEVRPRAAESAFYEVGGETASDLATAPILGIVGGKVASPLKAPLKTAIVKALKKFAGVEVAQVGGEIGTTVGQYHVSEAIGIPQPGIWNQIGQTIGVAGLQTLIMYPLGIAAARTRGKTEATFKEELRRTVSNVLVDEYKLKPEQADLVSKVVSDQVQKVDAAKQAVEDLKQKKEKKKKAKPTREKVPPKIEKALETILRPEAAKPVVGVYPPLEPEKTFFAFKMKDGRIVSSPEATSHENLRETTKTNFDEVAQLGFVYEGQFFQHAAEIGRSLPKRVELVAKRAIKVEKPVAEVPVPEIPVAIEKVDATFVAMYRPLLPDRAAINWESKERTPWVRVAKTGNFVPYSPAKHNITNIAEMENAINPPRTPESDPEAKEPQVRREVTFVELRPSEDPKMPHAMVKEADGTPAVFNPEIHRIINVEEAKRAVEVYEPPPEPKRKERIKKRKAIIKVEKPPVVPVAPPAELSEKSTSDEVIATLDRDRPGLTKHIVAMSKKGWSIEDFLNDPDFRADMEGLAKIELWPFIVGTTKEALDAETPADIWERMNKETLAKLDEDIAAIDRSTYEDTAQEQDEIIADEFGAEAEAVEEQKGEVIEQIKVQVTEPPPIVERPKVTPAKDVIKETAWYQTKEEAEAQFAELGRVKLSWDSDPYLIVHAIRTTINRSYHLGQPVDFNPINRLEDSISVFKPKTMLGEYEKLVQDVKSLQAYAVTVQNATEVKGASVDPNRYMIYSAVFEEFEEGLDKGKYNNISDLLKIFLQYKADIPADYTTLFRIMLDNPNTAEVLGAVPVRLGKTTSGSAMEFVPVIGRFGLINISRSSPVEFLPEMIAHEAIHVLTENALTRTTWALELGDLLQRARLGIPESDRAILANIGHTRMFYSRPYEAWRFSMDRETGRDIYYGLINEYEMLAMAFANRRFQQYLAKLETGKTLENGRPESLWDRFKEILSYIVYGRGLDERTSTLLDEILEVGFITMERSSEFAIRQASPKAEVARARGAAQRFEKTQHPSVKIAKVLETAPFKGTGEHAGEGVIAQTVFLKTPPPDILELSTWVWDPGFALRKFPEAQKMSTRAIDVLGTWNYKRSIGFMEIDRIMKPLTEEQQKKATSIMREIESGEAINLDTLDSKVKSAVVDLRNYFDSYDIRYRDHLREMLMMRLNQTELQIFSDVFVNGMNVIEATKKWNKFARNYNQQQRDLGLSNRIAATTYARVQKAFENWTEVEQWSIKDYVTHAMKGSIAILDPDGKVISFAESRSEAIEDATRYLQLNPQVESLTVDSTYRLDQDLPTLVSSRHYRVLKGKIAKLINQEAAELDKGIKEKLKAVLPGRAIAVKPRLVWTPFTQKREEVLPGEENIFDILPLYTHLMEKKMALDPYIYYFQKNIHKFNEQPNIKKMLEDQLEAMRGKYSVGDAMVDGVLEKFGFDTDFAYTRALSQARGVLTNLKLGYRQIASLINLMSGLGHVWVKTSVRHMHEAAKLLRTEEGKTFIKEHAPSLGISLVEGMGGSLTTRLRWYAPLKTFQAPEVPNREISFMASYLLGMEKFNFNKEEAIEFAKRSVDLQEFIYSVAALPKIMRGPTGKMIFQFKPYLAKEIEFIAQLEGPAQWAKYLTMQAVLAGPRGFMITLKSLPFIVLLKGEDWLDGIDRWLNANFPRLSRGVFGFFGIDASGPAAFQFPERLEDWAGITVSEIVRFGKQVVAPFLRDEKFLFEDLKKYSRGAVPIWRIWTDIFESIVDEEGWITDDHGRRRYKVESFWDLFKMAGGARPLAHTVQDLEVRIADRLNEKEQAQAHKIVEQIVKRSHRHDADLLTEEIVEQVAIHAIRPESIINAIKLSKLDPETRLLLETKIPRRLEVWQRSLPIREFQRGYPE